MTNYLSTLVVIGPGYNTAGTWGNLIPEATTPPVGLGKYSSSRISDQRNYYHYNVDPTTLPKSKTGWDFLSGKISSETCGGFDALLVMDGDFAKVASYAQDQAVKDLFTSFRAAGKVIASIGNGITLAANAGAFDGCDTIDVIGTFDSTPSFLNAPENLRFVTTDPTSSDVTPASAEKFRVVTATTNLNSNSVPSFVDHIRNLHGLKGIYNPHAGQRPGNTPGQQPTRHLEA